MFRNRNRLCCWRVNKICIYPEITAGCVAEHLAKYASVQESQQVGLLASQQNMHISRNQSRLFCSTFSKTCMPLGIIASCVLEHSAKYACVQKQQQIVLLNIQQNMLVSRNVSTISRLQENMHLRRSP
jgi:chromosome condensin MukBEF ATPase and DNA-binding subunit MukB